MKIIKEEVKKIKLDFFDNLINEFPYLKNEKEHYRLLVYLSNLFNNIVILDCGTCQGHSCLCLSQNKNNKIISYDIIKNKQLCDLSSFDNVELKILDVNKEKEEIIKSAEIIVLDIDPHDGIQEKIFFEYIENINYEGYVIVDDIFLSEKMKNFWENITQQKFDLTDIGHHSGTGLVIFGEKNIEIV